MNNLKRIIKRMNLEELRCDVFHPEVDPAGLDTAENQSGKQPDTH